mgnify:FL=1
MTVLIGIDPGKSGGIVAIDADNKVVASTRMPLTLGSKGDLDTSQVRRWLLELPETPSLIMLEMLQARPAGKMSTTSAITMGRAHGALEGLLIGLQLPHELPQPNAWKKAMGLPRRPAKEADKRKTDAISLCRRLLPDLDLIPGRCKKPQDGIAEAGLLAVYARRVFVQGMTL